MSKDPDEIEIKLRYHPIDKYNISTADIQVVTCPEDVLIRLGKPWNQDVLLTPEEAYELSYALARAVRGVER